MKTHYSISIPKPCHEDWSKMTPNEQGRFCQSCSKSVIDFTKMPKQEVQDYLAVNTGAKFCGRFKVSQLEQIRIEIPQHIIQQQRSFHKLFFLALLITMGTSLLNCSDENGNTKKIDTIEVISTLDAKSIQILELTASKIIIDSSKTTTIPKPSDPIQVQASPIPPIMGDVIEVIDVVGLIEPPKPDEDIVFGHIIEDVAEFTHTPDSLSKSEKKEYLSKHISKIITDNFNIEIAEKLGLKGKQRIFTQFKIDVNGDVVDINIRKSSHPELENEAKRVIKLLPKFKPAKQRNQNVAAIYTLPIVFLIED
ncbi:energy transducer TonB [Winogradskyella thalassocola]|uniref:TonB protein C-terminal n=1 Tax=Winogradskyella thalassocola TaxID=262004 RepID=A0A1G7VTR4_9FLAO|nr:energy transducer TonB [Winogradskyella thalassocola]SDG63192.1 TonB protein C-terminal [Winogradskyella thalassocola]